MGLLGSSGGILGLGVTGFSTTDVVLDENGRVTVAVPPSRVVSFIPIEDFGVQSGLGIESGTATTTVILADAGPAAAGKLIRVTYN